MANTKRYSICLILILFCLALIYGYQIHRGAENVLFTDYGKFYKSIQFYQTNKNLYTVTTLPSHKQLAPTLNPPFFILATLPLRYLSYATSFWLWSILSIIGGIISIWLLQKNIVALREKNILLLLSIFLFGYFPVFINIGFGQISLILLPILTGAWLATRKQQQILAGILLGILVSLKIIFGLFLLYFLIRREWRALFLFIVTIIFCALVPILFFGYHSYLDYFNTLHHISWYAASWNASIHGVLLRLFGGNESNIALLSLPHLTAILSTIISVALILGLSVFLKSTKDINQQSECDLDFSVVIVTMLLVSPLSWLYYFVWLFIPFGVLLQTFQRQNSFRLHLWLALSIALSSVPHLLLGPADIVNNNVLPIFLLSSCYFLALIIVLVLLYYLRFTKTSFDQTLSLNSTHLFIYSVAFLQALFAIEYMINGRVIFGVSS